MSATVSIPVKGPRGTDVQLLRGIAAIGGQLAKRVRDLRVAYEHRDWNLMRAALSVFADEFRPLSDELEKLARVLHGKADVQMPEPRADESAAAYVERVRRAGVEYVREEAG